MSQPIDTSLIPVGPMAERMGIKLISASSQEVIGTMPVEGNTQPFGLLNGGASMALVETLGSIGAVIHAGQDRIAVGIEISGTHHKSARTGLVTGKATPNHQSLRSSQTRLQAFRPRRHRLHTPMPCW